MGKLTSMEPQQEAFDTFGCWMVTRLRNDLALNQNHPASALERYFRGLYDDMLANPAAYFIPDEAFGGFIARVTLTPEESERHEALKAARMRVRKVIFAYLEFLYNLGKAGAPAGTDLQIAREAFEKLAAEADKRAKKRHLIDALERSGLSFSDGDPLVVSSSGFPGMPAELARFSQACAGVKEFDFYLFRRCDLAVLSGKNGPEISDAVRMAPQPFQKEIAETDERLRQLRFKREIFIDGGDMTYRVRYSKKGDQVVYWLRIQETFNTDLDHYLRWKLQTDVTSSLFGHLDRTHPGLADRVFEGVKTCQHCYGGNCMDRVLIERNGVVKEACKGSGWNHIGYERADYENLWAVLAALNELV